MLKINKLPNYLQVIFLILLFLSAYKGRMFIFINIRFAAFKTSLLKNRFFLQYRVCLRHFFINDLFPKMIFSRNCRQERINRSSDCWKKKQYTQLVFYRQKREIRESQTSATADNEADSRTYRTTVYLFFG